MSQNMPTEGVHSFAPKNAPLEPDHAHAREVLGALFTSSSFSRREAPSDFVSSKAETRRGAHF